VSSQRDQIASELLTLTLRGAATVFSEQDQRRLAAELAQFLDEGRVISNAVPASLEPLTMIVFEDGTDAA
jgi:hypothetical protein